ncbi:MAG TPA: hypothetical protein VNI56_05720, partial [Xanthomonadaceae bacterium]|nr:hypothetical protein [Xanthomonadaceae bacterium]
MATPTIPAADADTRDRAPLAAPESPAESPQRKKASGDDVIISVKGLDNRFGSQVVHEGLDLDVRRGEIIGVVGGSGS